ncbi:MAG TPA: hypothetical protein VHH10_06445 [Rubrobacteraceae bacterium]|nr:hypothetical protein [Rubrobacteraceae bacterium]
MSRVPLWALMILLVAIEVNPDSRVLVVALGAILITGGLLWLRYLLRRQDRNHNTN